LNGLWCDKPKRLTWDAGLKEYYDASGDLSVRGIGLVTRGGLTTFASENKEEVKIFIAGAKTMAKQIMNVAWIGVK
jgi:hypothetical protein